MTIDDGKDWSSLGFCSALSPSLSLYLRPFVPSCCCGRFVSVIIIIISRATIRISVYCSLFLLFLFLFIVVTQANPSRRRDVAAAAPCRLMRSALPFPIN